MSPIPNIDELADKLGVKIQSGRVIPVSDRSVDDVLTALRESGFKFLGYYNPKGQTERNKFYFNVGGNLLVANTNTAPPIKEPMRKPDGYKALYGF